MKDIKSRELRDRRSNASIGICFEFRATVLRRRLHTEGFQLSTIGSSTRGLHRGITNYNLRVYNSNSHTSTQEGATIISTHEGAQSKDENTTW